MATWWALKDRMEQALSASWGNLKIIFTHHVEAQGLSEYPPRLLESSASLSATDFASQAANRAISPENAGISEDDIFWRMLMTTSPIPWVQAISYFAILEAQSSQFYCRFACPGSHM
jgi:hypothetical protein